MGVFHVFKMNKCEKSRKASQIFLKLRPKNRQQKITTAVYVRSISITQPAFTCSKLTIETLEQGVKYVQS